MDPTPLPRAVLRAALRTPFVWVAGAGFLALGPLLGALARSGAIAQRGQSDLAWLGDVAWLATVTALAGTLAWLRGAGGLRWTLAGARRWWVEGATLLAAGIVGALVAGLLPSLTSSSPSLLPLARLVAHLAALALLCSLIERPLLPSWGLFLAVVGLGPMLGSITEGAMGRVILAFTDPRTSDGSGWWIVAALGCGAGAACSTWNRGRHASAHPLWDRGPSHVDEPM